MDVFSAARTYGSAVVVHAWGGPVAIVANYHAAFAGGGKLVEYPMLDFPVRQAMLAEPMRIDNGRLLAPRLPGIGVTLTPQIEKEYSFREETVYNCQGVQFESPPDSAWE